MKSIVSPSMVMLALIGGAMVVVSPQVFAAPSEEGAEQIGDQTGNSGQQQRQRDREQRQRERDRDQRQRQRSRGRIGYQDPNDKDASNQQPLDPDKDKSHQENK